MVFFTERSVSLHSAEKHELKVDVLVLWGNGFISACSLSWKSCNS